jgi:hypothetical protein
LLAIAASDVSGLGTAAVLAAGTAVGNLVQVQTGGKLPALDASLLTGLPTAPVTSVAALTGAITAAALKTALAIAAGDVSGLGALSVLSSITASLISDASANGRSLITAANYAAMKTLLAIAAADISDASANGRSLITAANYAAMKALLAIAASDVSGLGTAAALNVGTGASQVVQLTAASKLPAVDGSLLTNLPATGAPIPSSSSLPVGFAGLMSTVFPATTTANGATVSGANIASTLISSTGVVSVGSAQSGTWKNISGTSINSGDGGLFVRTA